jgi:hypothetical protein
MSDRQQTQQDEVFVSKNLVNLQMFAPAPNAEGRNSNLQWGHYRGNPNITVWTGIVGDKKPIQARMDISTFRQLVSMVKQLINGEITKGISIENDTIDKRDDPDNKTRTTQSVTLVGRDAEGLVWISVQEKERPKIVFHFKLSDWHRIKIDGQPLDAKKASEAAALATLEGVLRAMEQSAYEWKERQRNGNGAASTGRTANTPTKRPKENDDSFFSDLP